MAFRLNHAGQGPMMVGIHIMLFHDINDTPGWFPHADIKKTILP